jgi:hypothetical protein
MTPTTALISRERWAVDDPYLDFIIYMHDIWIFKQMRPCSCKIICECEYNDSK